MLCDTGIIPKISSEVNLFWIKNNSLKAFRKHSETRYMHFLEDINFYLGRALAHSPCLNHLMISVILLLNFADETNEKILMYVFRDLILDQKMLYHTFCHGKMFQKENPIASPKQFWLFCAREQCAYLKIWLHQSRMTQLLLPFFSGQIFRSSCWIKNAL